MRNTSHALAIEVEGLSKRYGERAVVDGLDLHIPRGVVVGFIGPNGAGKTTTMAMLLGLVRPTSGHGTVLGHDLADPRSFLPRVGALIEGPGLWPALTGRENLRAVAALGRHDPGQIDDLLDFVGLGAAATQRYGRYSLGMKQRLGIAAALLGRPELLVLDEPTNGLDPAGIHEMRRLIAQIASNDRTVVVSSHILAELEQVCDWLVVIEQGRLLYQGAAADFSSLAPTTLLLVPERPGDVTRLARILHTEGCSAAADGDSVVVTVEGDESRALAARLNRVAHDEGIVLVELATHRPNLEDHYLTMTKGSAA